MGEFWLLLVIPVVVIVGNLLVLRRTATTLHTPDSVKPQPYSEDDEESW